MFGWGRVRTLLVGVVSVSASAAPPGWYALEGGPSGAVNVLMPMSTQAGPRLYLGGAFGGASGVASQGVLAWTGSAFEPGPGLSEPEVLALTVYPLGGVPTLIAGGFGGVRALVGGSWSALPGLPNGWIGGLGVFDAGTGPRLIASGAITLEGSDYIAQYDGQRWQGMGQGIVSIARSMAVFDGGSGPRLFATWPPNGSSVAFVLGVWNGEAWSAMGTDQQVGFRPVVLWVHDDGSGAALYLGGDARWTPGGLRRFDGAAWSMVGGGVLGGSVEAMTTYDDGTGAALYVGGSFTSAGGVPASGIARWKQGRWSPLGAGLSGGTVRALAVFDEDGPGPAPASLYLAGTFTHAGGLHSPFVARWGPPVCRGDWTHDGVVDFNDLLAFLNDYTSLDEYADLTGDGEWDFNDVLEFLNHYNEGC